METPHHTFVAETGQQAPRRRKARLACNPCRARKTGCDGRKPVCTACSLRGWEDKCSYPDSVMQPSAALTLVDLDRRLQRLENEALVEPDLARRAALDAPQPPGSGPGTAGGSGRDRDEPSLGQQQLDAYAENEAVTATTAAFMQEGLEAAGPQLTQGSTTSSQSLVAEPRSPTFPDLVGFSVQLLDPQGAEDIDPQAMTLPPRPFADDLLRWYWLNIHSVFPFLHWPLFEAKYQSLWKQKAPSGHEPRAFEDVLFYATVNMVLALACLLNGATSLTQRQNQADELYRRSLQLICVETLDVSSIPVVQLLLLRGMFLFFAGRADRCWLVVGAATRMAVGLGLHTTPKRPLDQLEREMRRRVWYAGCVSMDLTVARTFGRPGMISSGLCQEPLPLPVDEEYLSSTEESRQPDGIPSRIDFLIYSIKAMEIIGEMRAAARTPRLKIGNAHNEFLVPDPSAVLRLNSRIDDHLEELPSYLRVDADYSSLPLSDDAVKAFRSQSHALRFRLQLLRLLLLRPSLLAEAQRWAAMRQTATPTASVMLQERLHQEVCSLCLTTVHTTIEEIHRSLAESGEIQRWNMLHLTFASATALLVATLSPNLGVSLDMEPAKSSWNRALAILDSHKAYVTSAGRGVEVLHRYRESITVRAAARTGTTLPPLVPSTPGESIERLVYSDSFSGEVLSPTHQTQNITLLPTPDQHTVLPEQQQQRQQRRHLRSWEPLQAMPTPPTGMAETGTEAGAMGLGMEGLEELLVSDSLESAWLSTQDFGMGDWMLR